MKKEINSLYIKSNSSKKWYYHNTLNKPTIQVSKSIIDIIYKVNE